MIHSCRDASNTAWAWWNPLEQQWQGSSPKRATACKHCAGWQREQSSVLVPPSWDVWGAGSLLPHRALAKDEAPKWWGTHIWKPHYQLEKEKKIKQRPHFSSFFHLSFYFTLPALRPSFILHAMDSSGISLWSFSSISTKPLQNFAGSPHRAALVLKAN